jgi:hypothetical protein
MVVQSSSHDTGIKAARGHCLGFGDFSIAVKRFAYLRDGLFLVCCSLYGLNRWMIKPHTHNVFLRFHFDDLLLMPCALPVLLWLQRGLRLRDSDVPPTWNELALYTVFWSILFEVIGPHLFRRSTGDPWDVVVYVLGGIGAGLWWNRHKLFSRRTAHEL